MRHYPQTLAFLLAFLFYNDGIQTVIVSASVYASRELRIDDNLVLATFLLTQFVAILGALGFGRVAAVIRGEEDRPGRHRDLVGGGPGGGS